MIKGIGIDLIENKRIKILYKKYGLSFAKKILSVDELREFLVSKEPVNYLSKHFASKEALSKVLGTGLYRHGVFPSNITITHDPMGKPEFVIDASLESIISNKSITSLFLSISDTTNYSTAIVIGG